MRLDHGLLNVPLAMRGDIEKQIDAHKAQAAKEAKAARRAASTENARDRQKAHDLLDGTPDDRLQRLAERCGKTVAAMRKYLRSECHWQPKLVISLLS